MTVFRISIAGGLADLTDYTGEGKCSEVTLIFEGADGGYVRLSGHTRKITDGSVTLPIEYFPDGRSEVILTLPDRELSLPAMERDRDRVYPADPGEREYRALTARIGRIESSIEALLTSVNELSEKIELKISF